MRIVQVFEKKLYFLSIYFDFTVPFALRFIFNMILSENFLSLRKNYIFWAYILILLRHPPWDFLNMILSENCSEKKLYFLSYCAICLEIFFNMILSENFSGFEEKLYFLIVCFDFTAPSILRFFNMILSSKTWYFEWENFDIYFFDSMILNENLFWKINFWYMIFFERDKRKSLCIWEFGVWIF